MKKTKVYLTLQNSDVFEGYRFGADGEITGELVFSTGMVGYVETLTDPSNYGQIVVQTFPLIGNYGVNRKDMESEKTHVSAFVVREICNDPSNFRMEEELNSFMKEQGVIGIYGVDTRRLTKVLREEGVMTARISNKPLSFEAFEDLTDYSIKNAVQAVSSTQTQTFGEENSQYTVALWDMGAKNSTIASLIEKGCRVVKLPACASVEQILSVGADGIMISDGPGDPEENKDVIAKIKDILGKTPIFGVGLGHQLLALAFGAETYKRKCGHRGSNQPVKCLTNGKVYISTQNHGYDLLPETIQKGKISFVNVNDGSCEGIDYDDQKAFGVQFVPETCVAGTTENPLYEKFFAMMKKEKENA